MTANRLKTVKHTSMRTTRPPLHAMEIAFCRREAAETQTAHWIIGSLF